MADEKVAKREALAVPPYLSFKTFKNFIDSLKVGIPTRIDRTVLSSMSGAVRSQLMAALRYLGLVSPHGVTTEKLATLVNSEGAEFSLALRAILKEGYPFLFQDFDLMRATTGQMEEAFRKAGASGETIRKCVSFFLAAAKASALPISPHVKTSSVSRTPSTKAKRSNGASTGDVVAAAAPSPNAPLSPPMATWSQMLLAKFPSFDPNWPNEVKAKWFESFEKLMKSEGKA
jgi:hypothetical protein